MKFIISTSYDLFRLLRMPFGLGNVNQTFFVEFKSYEEASVYTVGKEALKLHLHENFEPSRFKIFVLSQ